MAHPHPVVSEAGQEPESQDQGAAMHGLADACPSGYEDLHLIPKAAPVSWCLASCCPWPSMNLSAGPLRDQLEIPQMISTFFSAGLTPLLEFSFPQSL